MDKDETSSDFEYHESEAQDFGQSHGTQHTHAILAVAAGIKELVELLRPLVETVTAKPEPLTLRTDGTGSMPCLAGDPGSNGFRRCMEPYGHDGDHVHRSRMTGVDYAWAQPPGDVPPVDPVTSAALFPWPVVADIEYGPDNSESGRCTATMGTARCAYRRDQHYPYDRSAPRVHASEYLDGEGAIWR